MKYSTTIALLLGSASAAPATWTELANGNCSVDTVTADTEESQLTTCSSLAECAADADCADSDEKCGYYASTTADGTDVEAGQCVYKYACGDVGLRGAATWQLLCYDDTEPEEFPNTDTVFANVEDVVNEAEVKEWADTIENMKVPARDNYQTGRWIRAEEGENLWAETDKPVNNLCAANTDCGDGECCANWPDSNNLRCIASNLAGVEQSLEPFYAFTPACAVNTNVAPTSAKDDLAAEASAKAASELENFQEELLTEAKAAAKYGTMTAAEEEEFDAEWAATQLEEEAAFEAEREVAEWSAMDDNQKAIWNGELLKWQEETYAACKANPKAIECVKAKDLRAERERIRNGLSYYTGYTAEEREEDDDEWEEKEKKEFKAQLTAAFLTANTPAAGEAGSACSADKACTGTNHCCGTSTPKGEDADDAVEGKCADKTTLTWTDALGTEYTHVCGAQKLMIAASALFATAYLM